MAVSEAASRFPLPGFSPEIQADLFLSRWSKSARHCDPEVEDWVRRQLGIVITSYSIHYTKLYESSMPCST